MRYEGARWGNHSTHAGCDATLPADRALDLRTQTDEEKRAFD